MSTETNTASAAPEDLDKRSFSEKHPDFIKAAKVTGHYLAMTAALVVSTLIVVEIMKRYGNIKNDGTIGTMDQF